MNDTYSRFEAINLCRDLSHAGICAMPDKLPGNRYLIRVNIRYTHDGFDNLLSDFGLKMYDLYIVSDVLACCKA